ncbi:pesticidal protein Cry7Aa [Chitinophaga eiseniae]|uniref:Pesticidal protein Cry7Aa n=1 Tax=Chitinophaga eiseniae TaxID=634771 RepID=A0A847S360_9BACT|nr:pesticidal protein Cry7Aa [Chitinophaga eiseniae]NLR77730.1 pesticidal protein Cry7Aa [Chitinophaga eiseniae]
MIRIKKDGVILRQTALDFENEGVLNPATIKDGGQILFYYRAVRRGNHSSIGFCALSDPLTVAERLTSPILFPEHSFEAKGMEDPRVVKIDGLYYLTYTAYDGVNACGALATSKDGRRFKKEGLIVAEMELKTFIQLASTHAPLDEKYNLFNSNSARLWDKDVIFFPRRIKGKLHFLHRIKPDIQVVAVNEISELTPDFWKNYFLHFHEHLLLTPKYAHESSYVGGGCPPVETPEGWLLIYHGVRQTAKGFIYVGCAALLDLDNPQIVRARLPHPILVPERVWETRGDVDNVCFPTGTVLVNDTLYIYYGAGDDVIAVGAVSLQEILQALLAHKTV